MAFLSIKEISKRWNISERSVRYYCSSGKIPGAFLSGKTWNIPDDAINPSKKNKVIDNKLLQILKEEKEHSILGGIYHKTQIDLTYNSNHIEGSKLNHDQTRYIFETNTLTFGDDAINLDDIFETVNHFKCIDYIIDHALEPLSESIIKKLHFILKSNTSDSNKKHFNVGEYKLRPNEIGGKETCPPKEVANAINSLIDSYNTKENITLEDIVEFHKKFEDIHPFQDGNGRVGRLIMFKECLRNNITPFIIDEQHRFFYYRGLKEWNEEKGYLLDTCLSCQDIYSTWLAYFNIDN